MGREYTDIKALTDMQLLNTVRNVLLQFVVSVP